ncbi:MAG: hypothetical protein COU70_00035 [Parcubacteria group bacterium CG10_big_fil_rev_8_21_14_0_10_35_15]|nr:MAG: hypothetical protein COU70_00035 [Parcubacteria group bacterium CG10_big_fil_rev_8_21_14_0_10_35_15]
MKTINVLLSGVRWFTQRVTMLICVPMWVVGVPALEVWVLNLTGLWAANDALYPNGSFWILFMISRLALAVMWIALAWGLTELGTKTDFFWFNQEQSSYSKTEPKDKSGMIIGIISMCLICIFFAEVAVRLITGLPIPYLPSK